MVSSCDMATIAELDDAAAAADIQRDSRGQHLDERHQRRRRHQGRRCRRPGGRDATVMVCGSGQMQRHHRQVHQRDDNPGPRRSVTPEFARAVQARRDHHREERGRDRVGRVAEHGRVQTGRARRDQGTRPPSDGF